MKKSVDSNWGPRSVGYVKPNNLFCKKTKMTVLVWLPANVPSCEPVHACKKVAMFSGWGNRSDEVDMHVAKACIRSVNGSDRCFAVTMHLGRLARNATFCLFLNNFFSGHPSNVPLSGE